MENKLLLWNNLQRRGFECPSLYSLCMNDSESNMHLFVGCDFTCGVWVRVLHTLKFTGNWQGDSISDCFKNWIQQNSHFPHLPVFLCSIIWLERNLVLFENGIPSIQRASYRTLSFLRDFCTEKKRKKPRRQLLRDVTRDPTSWFDREVSGWFDGAASTSGQNNGVGGIIKKSYFRTFKWYFNCGPTTNTRAELLGAWALFTLVVRLDLLEISVYGDSKIIIDWLCGKGQLQLHNLEGWKERILELTSNFHSISFQHIFCE